MANVIARVNRPALVLAPNKTLAAQLYNEFRALFPENAVESFRQLLRLLPAGSLCSRVRYLHRKRLGHQRRHRQAPSRGHPRLADAARRDHCGLRLVHLRPRLARVLRAADHPRGGGAARQHQDSIITRLVDVQYERDDIDFHRGTFRVRGDVLEGYPRLRA